MTKGSRKALRDVATCAALTLLTVLATSTATFAQTAIDSVWVGQDNDFSRLNADNGALIAALSDTTVGQVAIDEQRGIIWTYGKKTLTAIDLNDQVLFSLPIGDADKDKISMVVDSADGQLWLATEKFVFAVSAIGEVLATYTLEKDHRGIAYVPEYEELIVATEKKVFAFDRLLTEFRELPIAEKPEIKALAYVEADGALWLGRKESLEKYDTDGNLAYQMMLKDIKRMDADRDGHVVVVAKKRLLRISSQSNAIVYDVEPLDGDEIKAIGVHPEDGSVWVGKDKQLAKVDATGATVITTTTPSKVRDIATYTASTAPVLTILSPAEGEVVNDNRPTIEIRHIDPDGNIDLDGLLIVANEAFLDTLCASTETMSVCVPDNPIPDGVVELGAFILDLDNNMSNFDTQAFTVDTSVTQ